MTISFSELSLAPALLRNLDSLGYQHATPIQAQAIPRLCAGADLLGLAQTGTGKTAAFVLPLLQRLATAPGAGPGAKATALILAPTRELAAQIGDCIRDYSKGMGRRYTVIFGGVGQRPQVQALHRGLDIIVATPGRLLDLIEQGHCKLDNVSYLVLDEADRLLDMGFMPHIRRILRQLPKQRQSLLFSATMPKELESLANELLNSPERIDIAPKAVTVDRVDQRLLHVDTSNKLNVLSDLLREDAVRSAIVFTRTKHRANKVAEQLEKQGIGAEAIHGNKSQGARQRALSRFRDGKAWVLVATDIAARGIDIDGVTHVFNYELPNEPESYVHRIGRTARAGADGTAVALCDRSEIGHLRAIERLTKRPLTVDTHALSTATPAANVQGGGARGGSAARPQRRNGQSRNSAGNGNSYGGSRGSQRSSRSSSQTGAAGQGNRSQRRPGNRLKKEVS